MASIRLPPARRAVTSLLIGAAMLVPLGYQLYMVALVLAGEQPDTPF
jgi:hypothetical protein